MPVRPSTAASRQDSSDLYSGFPPILVNIGDLLSYWTNGLLKSTVHRVVFPKQEQSVDTDTTSLPAEDRYSMAYFCHPRDETELTPVPSKLVQEQSEQVPGPGRGPAAADGVMTARQYLAGRLAATYGGSPDEYQ